MADRLLLIEREAGELLALGEFCERLGYEVWREVSAPQGIETFRRVQPDFVVLTSFDLLEQLRQENASVILLTPQTDGEHGARATERLRALLSQRAQARRHHAQSLSEVERQHIERTLRHHGGNRTRAAVELGISRATLINKIRAYGWPKNQS